MLCLATLVLASPLGNIGDVQMEPIVPSLASLYSTDPQHKCNDRIECFMETVDDTQTPTLDHRGAFEMPNISPMQRAWARDGAVWLKGLIPSGLVDRYTHYWYKHSPGPGGWGHPTPYVEHEHIRELALYTPLMKALQEVIGGEMVLHLTLTGFKSTTRSWHQDDFLNAPCVNSWYVAVWIALEDIHPDSGPFQFVPGSHRWPLLRQAKVKHQMKPEEADSLLWPTYSEKVIEPLFEEKFRRHNLKPTDFLARKGDVLIWHGRLAHQGTHPINKTLERRSLIAHYTEREHHLCSGVPASMHVRDRTEGDAYHKNHGGLYYNFSSTSKEFLSSTATTR